MPHFTEKLPTKRMAADCLFTDAAGRILLLDPPYKPTWDLPGGAVERNESPRLAAQREVHEELGLTIEPGALLTVDWIAQAGEFTEVVAFLFDGGLLRPADIARITLNPTEARRYTFATLPESQHLLDPGQHARTAAALTARAASTTAYLENGRPDG